MTKNLNLSMTDWLQSLSDSWNLDIQGVAIELAEEEISNRIGKYPSLKNALLESPFDLNNFASIAHQCFVLGGRFDSVRFNRFIGKGSESVRLIERLIHDFPQENDAAIQRIDRFIEDAVLMGYAKPNGTFDWAGSAQLASLMLTAVYPDRFADYRQSRWLKLANEFGYETPALEASHGTWIVWAGKFASEITSTPIYKRYWPKSDPRLCHPNWVISGICWVGLKPERPVSDPIDPENRFYEEGAKKRRLHLLRERNRAVVAKAKELRIEIDPLLHCEICNFSYLQKYGQIGKGFIEAHHIVPISELKEGSRTSPEDLALICSNCHRMIHSGGITRTVAELKERLV